MTKKYCLRQVAIVVLFALGVAGAANGQTLPVGRWRCYQPPAFTVMAWFDLTSGSIAVDGNDPQPIRVEGVRVVLPASALPPYREALYLAPGATQGDAERHTLVLQRTPGKHTESRLPRCYLTTH